MSTPTTADTRTPEEKAKALATVRAAAGYLKDWAFFQAAHRQAVGMQIAVRYGDEVVLDAAWGLADVSTGEALTTEHLFRIASHSKTFTATALFQLAEAGRLRLDDTVGSYVPELAEAGHPVAGRTLRQLLGHQAGVIRDGQVADFWSLTGPFPDRAALLADVLAAGEVYEADQYFKYSNVGYSLLGLVVEQVTGTTFAEHLKACVVEPLGLTRTGAEYEPARAAEYAAGHTAKLDADDVRETIEHVDTRAMAAATGFYSTAREMTTYGAAHVLGNDVLLSDASKRTMQRLESVVEAFGTEVGRYGVGMDVKTIGSRAVVGHSGGYPGHITRTYVDPVEGLVVSVLTNAIDGPADPIAQGVVKLVDLALNAPAEATGPTPGVDGAPAASTFTGRYAALWGVMDVVELGGRLVWVSPGVPDPTLAYDELEVVDADTLRHTAHPGFGSVGEPVTFDRDETGAVRQICSGGMSALPIADFRARRTAMTRHRSVYDPARAASLG